MKVSNLALNVGTAIGYPFVLVFTFIIVFTLYPLAMLMYFPDGTEEGTDFYEFKNDFIEKWSSPKKFLTTTWQVCKDNTRECNQEMKESWPIFIALVIIAFLPVTVCWICGWL